MTTKARVKSVAYIGWRGILGCEVIELGDSPMTGLLGSSGAGKTTLALCLTNALLPDRKVLDIQPISGVTDVQAAGTDALAGKIDPEADFAYVVLDIATRLGKRLIAGIYAEKVDERAELTRWLINNVPEDVQLKDLMAVMEEDDQVSYPAYPGLKQHLATRGIDVTTCRTIGEYGQALHEAGILPSSMRNKTDRSLYANLLKTTFRGGLSGEVASRLKEYLLTGQRQVPEIVRGLQECADEIFKTKSAITAADKELTLLQSTYGLGREIIASSLRWLCGEKDTYEEQLEIETELLDENETRKKTLEKSIEQLKEQIQETEDKKQEARKKAQHDLNEFHFRKEKVLTQQRTINDSLKEAQEERRQYETGKDLWLGIQKLCSAATHEEAWDWVEEKIEEIGKKNFKIEEQLEAAHEEMQRLEHGRSTVAAEILASRAGGDSLDKAFASLSEKEALATELTLFGMIEGVVGVDKNILKDLPVENDLPETFWLGSSTPQSQEVESIGDWLVTTAHCGHVVTHKGRQPIFGLDAKEKRMEILRGKIKNYKKELTSLSLEKARFASKDNGLRTLLDQRKEQVIYYLDNRRTFEIKNREAEILSAVEKVALDIASLIKEIKKANKSIQVSDKPFDDELAVLRKEFNSQQLETSGLEKILPSIRKRIKEHREALTKIYHEEKEAKTILGEEFDSMLEFSSQLSGFEIDDVAETLMGKITELRFVLIEEVPERKEFLESIRAKDRIKTIQLWPLLLEIVRERINIDLANTDGMALIQAAKVRRAELNSELVAHEKNAKVRAKGIANTIRATINSSKLKIDKLSRLGHDIQFGNIVGIRLRLVPKKEMLELLDQFSGQLALFVENKPIEAALKEWFDKGLGEETGRVLKGADLLDYRNYVNLAVEAKWMGGDWASVASASLSGGESIGCGLALALMLMRSIAARGEVKPELITPLFTMDEIHRLDDKGVAMIVNLAKRENFQVVVTAQRITPSYDCTLYNLTRLPDPDRLIIRGIKIHTEQKAA
jgi:energy-coupling factor transporter ATP-binding protein EcfA2